MKIENSTRSIAVAEEFKFARSFSDRIFGLLKRENPRAMIFKTRFGIHTFGMREAIDVMVLDKTYRVKKLVSPLKPNRILLWNFKYPYVIELPFRTISRSDTHFNDIIKFY